MDEYFEYYSSWIWMVIHVAAGTEQYSDAQALASRFLLPIERVHAVLDSLHKIGLVKKTGSRWQMTEQDVHLPARSFMNAVSHRNWRDRASLDIEKHRPESLHYTSVFSISQKDAEILRAKLLKTFEAFRKTIKSSPSEEVFCLLCDFFKP